MVVSVILDSALEDVEMGRVGLERARDKVVIAAERERNINA